MSVKGAPMGLALTRLKGIQLVVCEVRRSYLVIYFEPVNVNPVNVISVGWFYGKVLQ